MCDVALKITFANSFFKRLFGMYFRNNTAIVFKGVKSIHSMFMKKTCEVHTFSKDLLPIRRFVLYPNKLVTIDKAEKYIVEVRK
jgi:hypothetical protein